MEGFTPLWGHRRECWRLLISAVFKSRQDDCWPFGCQTPLTSAIRHDAAHLPLILLTMQSDEGTLSSRDRVSAVFEPASQTMMEVVFAVVIVGCSSQGALCDIEQPTGEKFVSLAACRSYATTYTTETEALKRLMQVHPDHVFTVICRPGHLNRYSPSGRHDD